LLDGISGASTTPDTRKMSPCAKRPRGSRLTSRSPKRKSRPELEMAEAIERIARTEIQDVVP